MITAASLSVPSAKAPLERSVVERREPGDHEVRIAISHAGICHSDIHQARGEWGRARFPMVPGHEITGVVEKAGAKVTRHAVGDRVGIGCFVDSCRSCPNCLAGEEQYCDEGETPTYNGLDRSGRPTFGGYSTHIVADENYVLRVPDGLDMAAAAPLLCAGITLYSPLAHWGAGPGKRVAVVGMGGLGHMGVRIAHAMGAEVTVLSQTLRKRDDALRLGASRCYATSDPETFRELAGGFDLIVNTVSANLDMNAYLRLLDRDGVLVVVGLPSEPDSYRAGTLLSRRRSIAGSKIGGIRQTQEMLDFCAGHGIGAEVEVIGADEVNAAYDRVVDGDVRYRFVIDVATLAAPGDGSAG
ncbi:MULTISPECIES: NAD(P)-dependent alcohol dehydrogenase [unclassified Streptomyces]|uniref:NAD(P)-dependent alcohol dehydrogenase n=1 Tax=unclassified Streptomyces TaxID=2593676 RepID=UPI000CD54D8F|nr:MULTISPECIES: NAD(P)-dependent alcohol dehydrogenase [unclassified Streptomyces]